MGEAVSGLATRSIAELPDLEALFPDRGAEAFAEDYAALFALDAPIVRAGPRRVLVFRNADLRAIAANPVVGNMSAGTRANRAYLDRPTAAAPAASAAADEDRAHLSRLYDNWIFTANPPVHGPTRDVFARPLMPIFMPQFTAVADRIVPALIDEVAGQGEIDFSFQFTERLAARLWGDFIGMTAEESERIVAAVRGMGPLFLQRRTPEQMRAMNAATGDYQHLIAAAVERTLRAGTNAVLNDMAAEFDRIDVEGKPESLGMALASNLLDGFHTAALAATNAVYRLLQDPDALAAVRENPALVRNALAEGLRMTPPLIITYRSALEAFEYRGFSIPQGTPIGMLWAAGNRDPAVFEDPNSYRLMRQQRPNATFGGGIHICPGRNVARVIIDAVLRGLTAPGVAIELTGPVEWIPRSTMRQPTRMPVVIGRS